MSGVDTHGAGVPPAGHPKARPWNASLNGDAVEPLCVSDIAEGGVEVIERLADEWRELCAEGPCNEPFFRPEWIAAYVRSFVPGRRLLVLTARDDGRLRAVLPLIAGHSRFHGLPVRVLRSAANVHSGRFDLVHGTGDGADGAINAVWRRLRDMTGWDVIELRDVPRGGAGEQLLVAAGRDGHPTGLWPRSPGPYLPLPGSGGSLEATLGHTSANLRANVRRQLRRLGTLGPVELHRIEQPTQTQLDRFYALERAGWKGAAGTAIACDARTRRFYDEIAREAARFGYLSLYVLECGDRPLAMELGLTLSGRYFVLKPAYDEEYKRYSPGHLLVHEVARDALERDLCEYDFMQDTDEFKLRWCPAAHEYANCYVFRRGLFGSALQWWKMRLLLRARQLKHARGERGRRGGRNPFTHRAPDRAEGTRGAEIFRSSKEAC